jgi:hypothetical protein
MPCEAGEFSRRFSEMLDGSPKDDETVSRAFEGMDTMFDRIAAGLYTLASMLAGEGEDSVRLVETAVATVEIPDSHDAAQARQNSRRALSAAALELLERRNPGCLAAPEGLASATTCIDDDDLDAASEALNELERLMAGPDRERAKAWLEGLSPIERTIFVLRAVAAFTADDTAALLRDHAGPQAAAWTPEAVREIFRQGLCSLASQLIHATTAR